MIANRLRELRNEQGLTQKEFAKKFGLSDARYNQYETGKRTPDIETLTLFANYYCVSLDYITGNTSERILNTNFSIIGKRLKKLRLEQDLKQKEVAEKMGMATSTIGMYERGMRQPDAEILTKFSNLFNVSSDYLLGISDKRDHSDLTKKDRKDISRTLDAIMEQMNNNEGEPLNYNGDELDENDKELLKDAIEVVLRQIKRKNKEKYTPNKYKK